VERSLLFSEEIKLTDKKTEKFRRTDSNNKVTELGIVKKYSKEKGYGFIMPDDGGPDVFIHASELAQSGIPSLNAGQRVRFRKYQGRNPGFRATDVQFDDEGRSKANVFDIFRPGTVKWFDPNKGYGFVTLDGRKEDVFLHFSALERSGVSVTEHLAEKRVKVQIAPAKKPNSMQVIKIMIS
jgi:cold shock CspA family protein